MANFKISDIIEIEIRNFLYILKYICNSVDTVSFNLSSSQQKRKSFSKGSNEMHLEQLQYY